MPAASRKLGTRATWIALASALLVLGSWETKASDPIVDTDGFETDFVIGALQGQQGWVTAGQGVSSATVQSDIVESGTMAVHVERGANSDDRWAVPVGGLGFPSHRYVLVDWDMRVTGTGATTVFGPFFGVDTYDYSVGPKVLGSLGVDASTGDVLYQAGGTGVLTETGASVDFDEWNHFQIILDFGLDQYQVLLNGSSLADTSFVDGVSDTFTDADIATFAANFDAGSLSQPGDAYFDNFLVRDVSPADFDIDGDVDDDDLATWQGAYGVSGAADSDFDLDSDGQDLLTWQQEYDGGAPLAASAAVPEPGSLTLLLSLGFGCGLGRLRLLS